jgi:hypothetical protein
MVSCSGMCHAFTSLDDHKQVQTYRSAPKAGGRGERRRNSINVDDWEKTKFLTQSRIKPEHLGHPARSPGIIYLLSSPVLT